MSIPAAATPNPTRSVGVDVRKAYSHRSTIINYRQKRPNVQADSGLSRPRSADHRVQGQLITTLYAGTQLYRQSFRTPTRTSTGSLEDDGVFSFFALEPAYGSDSSYGPIHSVWTLRRNLELLNISTAASRTNLADRFGIDANTITCNEQYDGGASNRRVHHLMHPAIENLRLDGTIMREAEADEDCEGANEVCVLQSALESALLLQHIKFS